MTVVYRAFLTLTVVLVLAVSTAARTPPPTARDVLVKALEQAKVEQKNVLIHFGASWCSWCMRLDAMLESAEVGKIFHENYVIAHLTIQESPDNVALENPGAEDMVNSAGAGGAGVPVYIFFDSAGQTLATSMAMPDGQNIGHPASPEEINAFDVLLEKTAPRITKEQRKLVSEYLSKQPR
ncbi:MAG TPA: thioredoxin family protein [Terriglobia bacterium]|nr:thioredoxin family protein [Terriglobia bacterium]